MTRGQPGTPPPDRDAPDGMRTPVQESLGVARESISTRRDLPRGFAAGTEVHLGRTVHGAHLSGLREARRVAEIVRGPARPAVPASLGLPHPHGDTFPTSRRAPVCMYCHGSQGS